MHLLFLVALLSVFSAVPACVNDQLPKTLEQASVRLAELTGRPVRPYATRDFGREIAAARS